MKTAITVHYTRRAYTRASRPRMPRARRMMSALEPLLASLPPLSQPNACHCANVVALHAKPLYLPEGVSMVLPTSCVAVDDPGSYLRPGRRHVPGRGAELVGLAAHCAFAHASVVRAVAVQHVGC